MNEIAFNRSSARTLTHVEPAEGLTMEDVVRHMNAGGTNFGYDENREEGTIVLESTGEIIATYAECQSTAAADVDTDFEFIRSN